MALPTFFHSNLESGDVDVVLDEHELLHARQARRLSAGFEVQVLNGRGLAATGKIVELSRRKFHIALEKYSLSPKAEHELTIAVAVPKGDRQRFMIESLTQLGVTRIQPLECGRSVGSSNVKIANKWPRYAIEASKQSQNPWLPDICSARHVEQWARGFTSGAKVQKYLADVSGVSLNELVAKDSAAQSHVIAVGPEGGFTEQEGKLLLELGFQKLTLGDNILRIETAAIACVARLQCLMK